MNALSSLDKDLDALGAVPPLSFVGTPENDVQKALRAGLLWFGPNGENWRKIDSGCSWEHGACVMVGLDRALLASNQELFNDAISFIWKALPGESLFKWNDHPDRTFADIRALFERAITLAAAQRILKRHPSIVHQVDDGTGTTLRSLQG